MEFTLVFIRVFLSDLLHASPILGCLVLSVGAIGFGIGRIEGWSGSDSLYHAFVNATTVGYGDFRPTKKTSKALAVLLALVGLVFTGMMVAIALHAADFAYGQVCNGSGFLDRSGALWFDTPYRS
jgi:voltage-gated potassium channel